MMSDQKSRVPDLPNLEPNVSDAIAAGLRVFGGSLNALPPEYAGVGTMTLESIATLIPRQQTERLVDFVKLLHRCLADLRQDLDEVQEKLRGGGEPLDIFSEGIRAALRAASAERRRRIAQLVANGLSSDELRHDETRKLLAILERLSDSEILFLVFYSLRGAEQAEFQRQHSPLIKPASARIGGAPEEREKRTLQDAYLATLEREDLLLKGSRGGYTPSPLGRMLLRLIGEKQQEGT